MAAGHCQLALGRAVASTTLFVVEWDTAFDYYKYHDLPVPQKLAQAGLRNYGAYAIRSLPECFSTSPAGQYFLGAECTLRHLKTTTRAKIQLQIISRNDGNPQ